MFNMNDMLADMLKKSIPPEVLAMLTKEKLEELGEKANAFITDIRTSLDTIKMQNETNYERQTRILEGIAELKELHNGGRSSQRRGGKSSERGGASGGDSSGDAGSVGAGGNV